GIGTLGIIDGDVVDLSNLQRQVLHHTGDVNKPKVESAREKIEALNPDVQVVPYHEFLTSRNVMEMIKDYDVIIDGTDNFPAKFLVNDAAVFAGKPLIHGGILRFIGQVYSILPGKTACYRCVFNAPPPAGMVPSCQEAGVIGVLAGLIGTIQATEALKLILGIGKPLTNRLLTYDAQKMEFREIKLKKNPNCPVCGEDPQIKDLIDYEQQVCNL
ncbi:MAG: ThiF family adenylyltransferase, partial [Nitrospirae bacterium]|nr:ThiF family adenylyltransferase [Nitrospirota bacterium]